MEKCDFLDFENFFLYIHIYTLKGFFLLYKSLNKTVTSLVLTETNKEKLTFFGPKAWVNPLFGKMLFLGLSIVKNGFFFFPTKL